MGDNLTTLRGYTNSSDLSGVEKLDFAAKYKTVLKRLLFHSPDTNVAYIPGIIFRDCKFYKLPLIIDNIEFVSALFSKSADINLKIFSKNLETWETVNIIFELKGVPHHQQCILFIQNLINFLNRVFDEHETVNFLNLQRISIDSFDSSFGERNIIYAINSLEISGFANAMSNVGKDNSFWLEYEIRNLPKSSYLSSIFINILVKKYDVYKKSYGILAAGETDKYWESWHPRRPVEGEGDIRQILLYEVKSHLSSYQELLTRLKD